MRVTPLISILSHKGRGCLCPNRDDTLSLEVRELFKLPLMGLSIGWPVRGLCRSVGMKMDQPVPLG